MTAMTPQAVEVAIDTACRTLRLPTIRERATHAAATAAREQHTYQGFLAELLLAECDDRDERRRARRVHEAGFPRPKRLDELDYAANPNLNPAVINTLAGAEWVAKGRPLCLIGDSGTGKTHLLIGLGTAAAEAGPREEVEADPLGFAPRPPDPVVVLPVEAGAEVVVVGVLTNDLHRLVTGPDQHGLFGAPVLEDALDPTTQQPGQHAEALRPVERVLERHAATRLALSRAAGN